MEASADSDVVLWDVIEELVAEADFMLQQTQRAFDASDLTLDGLAQGFEARLLAQLDGLAVGGAAVHRELLAATLRTFRPAYSSRLATLHLAALLLKQQAGVMTELSSEVASRRNAAEVALGLLGGPELAAWLIEVVPRTHDPRPLAAMLRLAARRGLQLAGLEVWLRDEEPEVAAAAAQVAMNGLWSASVTDLEALLTHAEAKVRDAATLSLLVHGSARAKARCRAWATRRVKPHPGAMLWLALSGEDLSYQVLIEQVAVESPAEAAVHALGYAGRLECVPRLLELMSTGTDACKRLAGEAFANLTGLKLEAPDFAIAGEVPANTLPPLVDDDLDANLVPSAVQRLPIPHAQAIGDWWNTHAETMPNAECVLAGKRWDLEGALEFLRRGPLRSRHPVAIWLTLHSRGQARVDTRALTSVQRAQIDACVQAKLAQ